MSLMPYICMKIITKPLTFESTILEVFVATDEPLERKTKSTRDISPWYNPEKDGKYLYYVGAITVDWVDKIKSLIDDFVKEEGNK